MAVFKIRYREAGGHVRCRLFAALQPNYTYAGCGEFTVKAGAEFEHLQSAMAGVFFEHNDGDDAILIHSPSNHLSSIDSLWAFLSVDEGGEGVCAVPLDNTMMPLIAADEARLASLRPLARSLSKMTRKVIRLVRFTERHEIEAIAPDGGSR